MIGEKNANGRLNERLGRALRVSSVPAAVAMLALALVPASAAAQRGRGPGSGGWGMGGPYQRHYDPQSVVTVSGTILEVREATPMRGMANGIHVVVRADTPGDDAKEQRITVHLGPTWFLERQDTRLAKGDQVTITGSRIRMGPNEEPVIIAATVARGDDTLVLRDERGVPVWAGWRRGGRGPAGMGGL